jgi:hypothetical protein
MGKVAGHKKRIIGTTVALVAIGGGAAFAYWTATGTGSTKSATGGETAFQITSTPLTGGLLSPGGPVQTATLTVTNPGTGVQKLQNVEVAIANGDGSPWTDGNCSATDFSASVSIAPTEIAKDGGTTTGTVTLQMVNRTANQNDCNGVEVPLLFTAS